MKIADKKTFHLEKCYSIAPLSYQGKDHILVAAEKVDKCLLFDLEGNLEDVVWDGPGGTMSMVQVPGGNGVFLATHKFYSPNDSKEAMIVMAWPEPGGWKVRTLARLPHVHRFDILERGGATYLVAATICSGRKYKDDWSEPGKVYACQLPKDLSPFDENHPLPLKPIKEGLLKNHGYCRMRDEKGDYGAVTAQEGVYRFLPPSKEGGQWEIQKLLDQPASDAVFVDFEGKGRPDLVSISPFHGDQVFIYRWKEGAYRQVFEKGDVNFGHAIWGGSLFGKPTAIIGHRQGSRDLLAFTYGQEPGAFHVEVLDENVGPANVFLYQREGIQCLVSANREIDQISFCQLVE